MSVGFAPRNLSAAVELVIQLAAQQKQNRTFQRIGQSTKFFDLTDPLQVRDYLMTKAEAAYEKAGRSVVAQVLDMPYFSVGIVCELNNAVDQVPPVICRSGERPAHVAQFWQVL